MARSKQSGLAFILALLCVPTSSIAQTTAVLQGRVFDASGGVLPGAVVSVRSDATNFSVSVSTDFEGRYFVVAIPPGTYRVEATATGLRPEPSNR